MRPLPVLLAAALLAPLIPASAALTVTVPDLDDRSAREWLVSNEGLADVDLAFEWVREGYALRHARFHQTVSGLPVEGTRAQVTVDREGNVVWTLADVKRNLDVAPCHGMREEALAAGRGALPGPVWTDPRAEHLVNHRGETVWRIHVLLQEPAGAWKAEVDCAGQVLRVWDGSMRFEAKARLFPVSPIVASADPDFRDNPAGSGATMGDLLVEVPLLGLNGPGPLRGKYAYIVTPAAFVSEGETLAFDRLDPRFEDVNTYFWIDWAQRHIQSLGFDQVHNHTTTIVPRLPGAYTAFYTGEPGSEIFFGWHGFPVTLLYGVEHIVVGKGGLADAAEDAHVIMHEYGHAILDYQAGICCTEEAGAMHEAYGDWTAVSFLTRWSNGTEDGCMGAWFGSYLKEAVTGEWPCYRNLNNNKTMADWKVGDDAHFNQLIWSGALWKTEKAYMERDGREAGAAAFERIMLESNYMLPQEATLKAAVRAMIVAENVHTGGRDRDLLAAEFLARGIITPEDIADLPIGAPVAEGGAAGEPTLPVPAAALPLLAAGAVLAALLRRRV